MGGLFSLLGSFLQSEGAEWDFGEKPSHETALPANSIFFAPLFSTILVIYKPSKSRRLALGAGSRVFKSPRPDQGFPTITRDSDEPLFLLVIVKMG